MKRKKKINIGMIITILKQKDILTLSFQSLYWSKIEEQSSLIDIGCGDGRDTHFFSENKIFSKGIDFSQETIKQNKPLSNKYLSFEHMDLEV